QRPRLTLFPYTTLFRSALIGMGAIVLDGAEIGARSIIGANALVTGGSRIPPGSLVLGSPGKVVRTLSLDEQGAIRGWAEKYVERSEEHTSELQSLRHLV